MAFVTPSETENRLGRGNNDVPPHFKRILSLCNFEPAFGREVYFHSDFFLFLPRLHKMDLLLRPRSYLAGRNQYS